MKKKTTAVVAVRATGKMPVAPVSTTTTDAVTGLRTQMAAVRRADDQAFLERAKLGVMLIRWEQYLGKSKAGRGSAGEGLKGWLEENIPELGYESARSYKAQALKFVEIMKCDAAKAQAALLGEATVVQPDGEVIEVEAEIVEKRDQLVSEITSRRKLEQMWFDLFGEAKGKPGRPKGSGKPAPESYAAVHKTAVENAATAYALVWRELDKKRQLPNLASLLKVEDAREILALVEPVYHALKKRVGEG